MTLSDIKAVGCTAMAFLFLPKAELTGEGCLLSSIAVESVTDPKGLSDGGRLQ